MSRCCGMAGGPSESPDGVKSRKELGRNRLPLAIRLNNSRTIEIEILLNALHTRFIIDNESFSSSSALNRLSNRLPNRLQNRLQNNAMDGAFRTVSKLWRVLARYQRVL